MSRLAVDAADFADCEVRDAWFLGQDVNAWTSLVYDAVGFVMVGVVVRHGLSRAFLALAGVTVLEGVGSLLYHGGSGDVAQFLHDVSLIGALGFVAGWHVARLIPSPPTASSSLDPRRRGPCRTAGRAGRFPRARTSGKR